MEIAWRPNGGEYPRLGVIVPRHGRTAVERNRLRRRLLEHARRRLLPNIPPIDLVLRARAGAYTATPNQLGADLDAWLHVLSRQ